MKSTFQPKFALLALLTPLVLSACTPAALQSQRNALVNVSAAPTAMNLTASAIDSGMYRTPGPTELAVRTDRNAFVTLLFLPNYAEYLGRDTPGTQVSGPVSVAGGTDTLIRLPTNTTSNMVYVVASVEPLNLGSAQGLTSERDIAKVLQAAAATLPAGGYNVTTVRYRVRDFGTLTINGNVPGARVQVNGRDVGSTPVVRLPNVPTGDVEITVSRQGWKTWTRTVRVEADTNNTVYAEMRRDIPMGTLTVTSSVNAIVYVQGDAVGQVGAGLSISVRVPAGRVSVTVTPIGVQGQPALNGAGTTVLIERDGTSVVSCSGTPFVCTGQ